MSVRRLTLGALASLIVAGTLAAVVFAGTGSAVHARNPTFKEREGITAAQPKSLRHDPVGCVYLQIFVSPDGRFARAEARFLNVLHGGPCVRYTFNGPDPILQKVGTRWKIIAQTGAVVSPACSLGIPGYLLLRPCRRN
jgi:hypothetical protein